MAESGELLTNYQRKTPPQVPMLLASCQRKQGAALTECMFYVSVHPGKHSSET